MRSNITTSNPITAREWLQLFATCLTGILIPLCFTGPAVVLTAISQELGGSVLQLNWVVNAYVLSYGSSMMAAGSLTDSYGRKRVWMIGLAVFVLSTFGIPLAPSVAWIDGLRLIQGLGGAAAFAGAMASLAQNFTGSLRIRVFSLLGTTFGLGLAFGPLASGWLVEMANWRWVFITTALIAVAGFLLVWMSITESRDPNANGLDWAGAISFTVALTLFTYAILLAPEQGWHSATLWTALLLAGVLSVFFVWVEGRSLRPMLDLSLFRDARFVGVQVLAASPAFFFVTLIVMLPIRFIGIDGMSALQAGQMMSALALPLLIVPILAALLSHRFSAGLLSGFGILLVAIGLVWLAQVLSNTNSTALIPPLALIGIGIGLPWGLMDGLAVSVVEKQRAGMATGIFNCVRVSADGIAIAMTTALLALLIQHHLLNSLPSTDSLQLIEAANRVALADIKQAVTLLPAQEQQLLQSYEHAFAQLLYLLAAAAALTVLLVFWLLRQIHPDQDHPHQNHTHQDHPQQITGKLEQ